MNLILLNTCKIYHVDFQLDKQHMKYPSIAQRGLVRAMRRTREKETNYVGQSSDEEIPVNKQTTAAKCELYIGKEPITAVVDSGAATSLMTSTLAENLGFIPDQPSRMVIVTANGTRVKALGVISKLPINISHKLIRSPVQVITSNDNVLILGNDWLERVQSIINYNDKTLTIKHQGRTMKIPITFTAGHKPFTVAETKETENEDEEEYETDYFESPIYLSDNAFSSDEEDPFHNPWENYSAPKPEPEMELEEELDEELAEESREDTLSPFSLRAFFLS